MRKIDMIVVHCSGSRCNHRYTLEQLRHDHVVVNDTAQRCAEEILQILAQEA